MPSPGGEGLAILAILGENSPAAIRNYPVFSQLGNPFQDGHLWPPWGPSWPSWALSSVVTCWLCQKEGVIPYFLNIALPRSRISFLHSTYSPRNQEMHHAACFPSTRGPGV